MGAVDYIDKRTRLSILISRVTNITMNLVTWKVINVWRL